MPVVITFNPGRPKKTPIGGKNYARDILSFKQKMEIFESLGVELTVFVDFTESFRQKSGTEFMRLLAEHGNMAYMAVGENFRCGYQKDTDVFTIQEFCRQRNIETCIVQPLMENGMPISSTLIRTAIARAELREAAAMLGRPFTVDLSGCFLSSGTSSGRRYVVYDVAEQERILPRTGYYFGKLLNKDRVPCKKLLSQIAVQRGCVSFGEEEGDDSYRAEYVEFID